MANRDPPRQQADSPPPPPLPSKPPTEARHAFHPCRHTYLESPSLHRRQPLPSPSPPPLTPASVLICERRWRRCSRRAARYDSTPSARPSPPSPPAPCGRPASPLRCVFPLSSPSPLCSRPLSEHGAPYLRSSPRAGPRPRRAILFPPPPHPLARPPPFVEPLHPSSPPSSRQPDCLTVDSPDMTYFQTHCAVGQPQ